MKLLLSTVVGLLVFPATSLAALVPVACEDPNQCGTCEFVSLINNVIQFTVQIGTLIAVLVFMYAGFLMVVSRGDTGQLTKAKSLFVNVLIGFVLMLSSFLIINTVLLTLVPGDSPVRAWQQIECLYPAEAKEVSSYAGGNVGSVSFVGAPLTNVGSSGGGSCVIPDGVGGPCSVSNLQKSGFSGAAAVQANQICSVESAFHPGNESKSDVTVDGRAYSVGLFQVNLAVHKLSCGGTSLNCPAAFDDAGRKNNIRTYKIINENLYNQCKALAKSASCNIEKALQLYRQSGDFGDWSCTTKKCGIPTSRNHLCQF